MYHAPVFKIKSINQKVTFEILFYKKKKEKKMYHTSINEKEVIGKKLKEK